MNIKRCSEQGSETLEEFYSELLEPERSMMLRLLEALGQTPGPANVWGLTSHENLVLLPVDDFQSPWHVTLLAAGDYYVIEYRTLTHSSIAAQTDSLDDAVPLVKNAMAKSGGWPGHFEG